MYAGLKIDSTRRRAVITAASFILYVILFFLFVDVGIEKVSVFSLLPIITASLFYCFKKGIAVSILIIPVNTFLFYTAGFDGVTIMTANIPGMIGSIFMAAGAGYMSHLHRLSAERLRIIQNDIQERQSWELKLFELQKEINAIRGGGEGGVRTEERINKAVEDEYFLAESSKFYQFAEYARDIMYTTDKIGRFVYINKAGELSSGYKKEELYGMSFLDLVLPEYKFKAMRVYREQLKSLRLTSYLEFPFRTKDGGIKWYGQNTTLVFKDGEPEALRVIAIDITEQKKLEVSLHESEERLRLITETASDAIVTTDKNLKILYWNESAVRIYGYTKDEVTGKSLFLFMPPEERGEADYFESNAEKIYDSLKIKTMERFGYSKGGFTFPVEVSIAKWSSGGEVFFTHIIRDISERKLNETKLKESEKDFTRLFNSAHEAIIVLRVDDEVVIEANRQACLIYGYKYEEFVGMSMKDISVDISAGEKRVKETIESGESVQFITKQFRRDGKILTFEVNASVTKYKGEMVILSLNRDITDSIETKKMLNLLANAIETTSEVVTVTGMDNRFLFVNKAFEKTYGYKKEEVLGKEPSILRPTHNKPEILSEVYSRTREGGWHGTLFNKKKNGEEIVIALSTSIIYDENGNAAGLMGVTRDITAEVLAEEERKKIEEQLDRYRFELEKLVAERTASLESVNEQLRIELNKQKEIDEKISKALAKEKELSEFRVRFITTASHEFRTPLTTILASADLIELMGNKITQEKLNQYLKNIQKSVSYMTGLLEDVLTIHKAEAGKLGFKPEMLDVKEVMEEIVSSVELLSPERIINRNYKLNGKKFNLDRKIFQQIINNLLINAVKYSPAGEPVSIDVEDGESLCITVTDQGIGIPTEDMQMICEPFHRAENTKDIAGTGLGLSIVKKGVEMHRGTMQIRSKENSGTTITVILPIN